MIAGELRFATRFLDWSEIHSISFWKFIAETWRSSVAGKVIGLSCVLALISATGYVVYRLFLSSQLSIQVRGWETRHTQTMSTTCSGNLAHNNPIHHDGFPAPRASSNICKFAGQTATSSKMSPIPAALRVRSGNNPSPPAISRAPLK